MTPSTLFAVLLRATSLVFALFGLLALGLSLIVESLIASHQEQLINNPDLYGKGSFHDMYFTYSGPDGNTALIFLLLAILLFFLAKPAAKFFTKNL